MCPSEAVTLTCITFLSARIKLCPNPSGAAFLCVHIPDIGEDNTSSALIASGIGSSASQGIGFLVASLSLMTILVREGRHEGYCNG